MSRTNGRPRERRRNNCCSLCLPMANESGSRSDSVGGVTGIAESKVRTPPRNSWPDCRRGRNGLKRSGKKAQRRAQDGATHMLFVQPDERAVVYAAMVPLSQVASIWAKQRDESARLIAAGRMGRRRKNHAENGRSPTIWLQDDKAPSVAAQLWRARGVVDLVKLPANVDGLIVAHPNDDTFDDLLIDPSALGTNSPARMESYSSSVKRDPRVRRAVAQRALGRCERDTCGTSRDFPGFLDVHHILGAAKSDRVYNCVALCPNCHREAHYSPNRDAINADLLKFASRFRV